MKDNLPNSLADIVAQFLNRGTLAMLPRNRRHWGQALVAEQNQINNTWKRIFWAAGGITMTAKDFLNRMFTERLAWAASIAGGMLCAFVDMAMDVPSSRRSARLRAGHQPLGAILDGSLRRVLRVSAGNTRHLRRHCAAPHVAPTEPWARGVTGSY
ncbi:MAG: hypothetical protein AUH15_02780 [Acidobacteriales bacterium 13_2_20CM_55_8]|nr:MAG: hypothetical protein AUH15_02780 [Acidobacteriales bacterium 13_2_20CM_55_8]